MKTIRTSLLTILFSLVILAASHQPAEGVIETIYSLPFAGQYEITCPFQWYSDPPCNLDRPGEFHYGTDYDLGIQDVPVPTGDHPVQAAARGTAKSCLYGFYTGYSVLIKHGNNGGRTRYLHLRDPALPSGSGQPVAVGQVIGYEGATGSGVTGPHLHFEVRQNAGSSFDCNNQQAGAALDPYGGPYSPGTYSWKTNPPSTARDLDFSGDGYPDVLAKETSTGTICLVRGNGAGGWFGNGDPGCGDGSPIGFGWNVYDLMFRPGDFNGDGYSDVLMRNPGSGGILCLLAGYRGDGYGYWIADPPDPACGDGTPIGTEWNFFDKIIGPGDMNGDGFNDVIGRKPNGDLCLLRGRGSGAGGSYFLEYPWNQTCHSGTLIGTGWNMYNSLVTPSDWAGNGDSCPDVVARQSTSPYWMKYHSGSCNTYFVEFSGVPIESAWSAFDWLLSVGDFGGAAGAPGDICSDVLRWYGGKHYVDMRRGNCNGGFLEARVVGYEWQMYNWLF